MMNMLKLRSNTVAFPTGPLPESYMNADRSGILWGVGISFIILEVIAFALRVVARQMKSVPFGWDDAFIIAGLVLNIALCGMYMATITYGGVGRHTLSVVREDPGWLDNGRRITWIIALFVACIVYFLAIACSKLAILHLYLRILQFGIARQIVRLVGVVVALQAIVCSFVTIFQCKPISSLWNSITGENCIASQTFLAYSTLPNIATDVVILILPLSTIWNLNLEKRVKFGITITFLTASVGMVVSIVRAIGFFNADPFDDPLWISVRMFAYTIAECGTYFMAACFPTYRPLLKRVKSFSYISRRLPKTHRNTDSFQVIGEEVSERGSRPVRRFESLLLSNMSYDVKSTSENNSAVKVLDRHIRQDGGV